MLWLKAFHIIFMVTWFAGLFYLPRLFVYHAMAEDVATRDTLKVMERKLLVMMNLGGALTWIFGLALILAWPAVYLSMGWLHLKLVLVLVLVAYHLWCWRLVRVFADDANARGHVWYRWFNEVPVLFLIAIVLLAILKPF
jgi:putative membrane protein